PWRQIALPFSRRQQTMFAADNKLYLMGGNDFTATTADCKAAFILGDGSINPFVSITPLLGPHEGADAQVYNNQFIMTGGRNTNTVFTDVHFVPWTGLFP